MFDELRRVIEEYIAWHSHPRLADGEPPYWNNETASVSMLVAAAARKKWLALAQYETERMSKGKQPGRGFCDLYLASDENWIEIEAKQIPAPYEYHRATSIDRALGLAIEQTKTLPSKDPCAALVFAVMQVPKDDRKADWPKHFVDVFGRARADLCWIWYDHKADKKYEWKDEDHVWPGLGIFLRLLERPPKHVPLRRRAQRRAGAPASTNLR